MKTLNKKAFAASVVLGLSVTGALTTIATSATAKSAATRSDTVNQGTAAVGYFKLPYNSNIVRVTGTGASLSVTSVNWDQFVRAGQPGYSIAPTIVVKYPWSDSLYAVSQWSPNPSQWIWHKLSGPEWARMGYRAPYIAGWIQGSTIYKFKTSDQLIIRGGDGVAHVLSFREWAATGFKSFATYNSMGYQKLSWHQNIAFLTDISSGQGFPIAAGKWAADGFPQPQVVRRFPGDQFYKNAGSDTVYYSGPSVSKALTYSEWIAAGAPAPAIRGTKPGTVPAPTPPPAVSATQAVINRNFELVNADRISQGLRPYRYNPEIARVAQEWSDRMASQPDQAPKSRFYHRTNADLAAHMPGNWITAGENIAYNSQPSAEALHTQFINSAGHRANIRSTKFTDIGIGYAVDANGYGWITQNFAQY